MENKNVLHSIKSKVLLIIMIPVLLTGLLMMANYSPNVKSNIREINKNYLKDLSIAYGELIEEEMLRSGEEQALGIDFLNANIADVGLSGVESSYGYVVSPDGTMLYHPTPEKIGEPVENEVVKGVVADIKAGKKVKNDVVEYEFKGAMKYAAVYVDEGAKFILVVSCDEDELFSPVVSINVRGALGVIFALIISMIIAFICSSLIIVKPLKSIEDVVIKVSDMDFTQNEEAGRLKDRKDEIGMMARAMSSLRRNLVDVVNGIKEHSDNLIASAATLHTGAVDTNTTMDQVEAAVDDIAQGATSQADETQKATENVIVMGNMVQETSAKVDELIASSVKVKEANENAMDILAELRRINQKTDEYIDMITKQTDITNQSALKIGDATRVIAEIAEETNLLSLNASIEAARAGEQGKGFAVVASEIQKLAEQSTESVKEIDAVINTLLADSERAVETMGQVRSIIEEQNEKMSHTDKAFEQIKEGVDLSVAGMDVIASRTKELDEARVNVVDVVSSLTAIAEQNAAATEETSAAVVEVASIVTGIAEQAQALDEIAKEMDEKMNIFKL
ncbi:MAG: methyl-accepting chemotaxis protein [Lachnospira sp.]|nr:methyl-accepting chemotaxis protein [Lachnospira sp.]